LMALRTKHFITVIAAQYDTMGYMLLEPMSYGCPIISTAVGGIPEVIKDKHNGLLVPSQDIDALAAACQSLISDNELTTSIAHQAWLDCKEKYSAKTVASKTIDTYQEAIDKLKQYNLN